MIFLFFRDISKYVRIEKIEFTLHSALPSWEEQSTTDKAAFKQSISIASGSLFSSISALICVFNLEMTSYIFLSSGCMGYLTDAVSLVSVFA